MPIRALLLLLAVTCSASAQSSAPVANPPLAVPKDAPDQVSKIFVAYNHTDTSGCAVAVSLAGNEILHAAFGMADLEHHVALAPDSVFEAGSVSKQFTAAAVLLLAEQGKLSLSDPISRYFPELPDYGTPITIDHLLHHTSGLRDWGSIAKAAGWPRATREYSNTWVLEIASQQKSLNYKPGDDWSYTNTGYNLLAILVQRVSGKSLARFTHDNIFVPLDMQTTSWRDDFQRIVPNRAIAYEQSGGVQRQIMPFENAYGNGGLLTTVDDLLRWNARALAARRSATLHLSKASSSQVASTTAARSSTRPDSFSPRTMERAKSATPAPPPGIAHGWATTLASSFQWPCCATQPKPTQRCWGTKLSMCIFRPRPRTRLLRQAKQTSLSFPIPWVFKKAVAITPSFPSTATTASSLRAATLPSPLSRQRHSDSRLMALRLSWEPMLQAKSPRCALWRWDTKWTPSTRWIEPSQRRPICRP